MTPAVILPFMEVTHHMALIPLAWLGYRHERRAEWWWLAGIFLVSWLADTVSHWTGTWFVSAIYPVSQAGIVGVVLLDRREALMFLGAVTLTGLAGVSIWGVRQPEVLLHTVAWLGVFLLVWPLPLGRLRLALLVMFGAAWLAWMAYVAVPGWASWLTYQAVRATGIGLFCWASLAPKPSVRLV